MEALEARALLSTVSANTTWLDVEVPHSPQESLSLAAVIGKKVIFESDYSNIETVYDAASRSFTKTVFAKPQNHPISLTIGNKAMLVGGFAIPGVPPSPSDIVNINIYDNDTGLWSTAQHSFARSGMSTAVVGDFAVFAGGSKNFLFGGITDRSSAIDVYDSRSGQWSAMAVPREHNSFRMFAVGNQLLFVGGYDGGRGELGPPASATDVYDFSTRQWTTRAPGPAALGGERATLGHLHFFALDFYRNRHGVYTANDHVDIYDDASEQWSTVKLSAARAYFSVATVDNKVIFAGGTTLSVRGAASAAVDIYDATTGQWSTAKLSEARSSPKVNTAGGVVLFSGGIKRVSSSGIVRSTAVDIYDSRSQRWSATTLAAAKHGISTATVGTQVIFVGTRVTEDDAADHNLDVYDTRTGKWSRSSVAVGSDVSADGGGEGIPSVVVDGQAIVNTHYAKPWHVLVPTDIAAPVVQTVAPGGVLAKQPKTFTWTPVPGATSYDLQFDNALFRHVYGNRWSPSWPVIAGAHKMRVFAHVGGGVVTGPLARFSVAGAQIEGRLKHGDVKLERSARGGGRIVGSATVAVNISRLNRESFPVTVSIYESYSPTLGASAVLLGSARVMQNPRWFAGEIQLTIRLDGLQRPSPFLDGLLIMTATTPLGTVQLDSSRKPSLLN